MPLRGFRCEVTDEELPFDVCLRCAETRHPCDFTPEILRGIVETNTQGREDAGISATMLVGCLRKSYYQVTKDYYQHPHKLWAAFRGTMMHLMDELYPSEDGIYETRFARRTESGLWITGKIDKLVPSRKLIADKKTKSQLPDRADPSYALQLNLYRWILRDAVVVSPGLQCPWEKGDKVTVEVEVLGLLYATMDGVRKYGVELMDLDWVGEFAEERAGQIKRALDGGEVPSRKFAAPEKSNFCRNWCPFLKQCLQDGGGVNEDDTDPILE